MFIILVRVCIKHAGVCSTAVKFGDIELLKQNEIPVQVFVPHSVIIVYAEN
jgi:hypothetical protein